MRTILTVTSLTAAISLLFACGSDTCLDGSDPVDGECPCDAFAGGTPPEWYPDADADGFGAGPPVAVCVVPAGYVASSGDCDDTDAAQYPGAIELCNGEDDDCDGRVDADATDAVMWFVDNDGDGFGDPATGVLACEGPTQAYVRDDRDCQDNASTVRPGAPELCDGIDNDCNNRVDDADCPLDLDPVAVGFEFDGVFDGSTLRGYSVDDGSGQLVELVPLVLVTFANADFFSATTDEDQLANSCEAYATFDFIAGESQLVGATMESSDTAVVWNHFDTSLSILPSNWEFEGDSELDNGCAFALDSEIWGNNGIDLLDAFTGVHFGIGFGPQTDYLASAWQDDSGDWVNEEVEELSVGMMSSYIAINDAAGANNSSEPFEGYDWSTSIAFEWNASTGAPVAGADGLLQVIDVTDADETPVSYIRSFAYWYQDLPLIDLDDLGRYP